MAAGAEAGEVARFTLLPVRIKCCFASASEAFEVQTRGVKYLGCSINAGLQDCCLFAATVKK